MALDWLIEDSAQYMSRGQRIISVLEGSGTFEIMPGRPDVELGNSDLKKGGDFDPDIPFDPNSFARMDKFDGVEVGQELIETALNNSNSASSNKSASAEEKQ
ncbi:hypothetical protein [Tortoise microvirus 110]|nr:hypothetical protein [Tortoise microvirus 7]QCS37418.1 hypothetical protein [Tortoise microvirus 102]QCS37461.1 hypothetical protein [Tortoise microvirus 105]QCS37498.1 hypothetical protein [Tortoise microvirus 110]